MSAHRNLWQCECVVEMASRDKCVCMNVHVSSPGIAVHVCFACSCSVDEYALVKAASPTSLCFKRISRSPCSCKSH